ncbi:MAG: hypothetical protein R3F31_19420 [Verrucomicrobiales bacterium]
MLAFDHGYFQGPTTGLERIDQTILPLEPYVDCLMLTRGIQRSIVPASTQKAIALRASGGTSMVSLMDEWESTGSEPGLRRPGYEPSPMNVSPAASKTLCDSMPASSRCRFSSAVSTSARPLRT